MIGAGDTVMVVYSCCSAPPYNPGWVGKVLDLHPREPLHCFDCGTIEHGPYAVVSDDEDLIPLAWLVKLDPPAEAETVAVAPTEAIEA